MKEKTKEISYAIAKGSVGSIPLAGGVLSELFGVAFSDPATKRKEQVIADMEERLESLENEGFDISSLGNSEEFLSISIQAYHIALRTHQTEKRVALMNAIYNTPKLTIDENEKLMFLNYIDQFNEWHLKILWFLNNPNEAFIDKQRPNHYTGSKSLLLEAEYPELKIRRNFYNQIVKDLYSRGLINTESLNVTMTGDGMFSSSTTESGKNFIKLITKK